MVSADSSISTSEVITGITFRTNPHEAPILALFQSRLNFDAPSTAVLFYCLLSLEKRLSDFCSFECFNVVSMQSTLRCPLYVFML